MGKMIDCCLDCCLEVCLVGGLFGWMVVGVEAERCLDRQHPLVVCSHPSSCAGIDSATLCLIQINMTQSIWSIQL